MPVEAVKLDEKRRIELFVPDEMDENRPLLILAHGAGNNMYSPFMETIAGQVHENYVNVVRFNFPYKVAEKGFPDRSDVLASAWRLAVSWVNSHLKFNGLFLGGKSMGGRIATMIAGDIRHLKGIVFLGYPLHAPGKYDRIRDEYLQQLSVPMLFIQGTRDAFARMDLLQNSLSNLRKFVTLHWIEGGDHSYKVLVRQGIHYPEVLKKVSDMTGEWIIETQQRNGRK